MALELIAILLGFFLLVMIILYRRLWIEHNKLGVDLKAVKFSKKSLSTKYGRMTEQFIPFLKVYPYDENNFRFLGTPIDGVQFEDDKVILMEFKTGDSQLTDRQKKIKELVKKNKIEFEEIRIS